MPRKKDLLPLSGRELATFPGLKVRKVSAKFPKRAASAAQARAAEKKWLRTQRAPKAPKETQFKLKGVRLAAKHLSHIRAVHESSSPSGEFVAQKLKPEAFLGELHSALSTLEYMKMQSEYRKQRRTARTAAASRKVDAQWQKVVKAGGAAFQSAGVRNVTERDLNGFAQNLVKRKADLNAITNIANSAKSVRSGTLSSTQTVGSFVPQVAVLPDPQKVVIPIDWNICERPLVGGKYTKHIGKSFSLTVRLTVWCPTFWKPWRTCTKTFTVAGASVSLDLEVGYEVTCCGARAWGSAAAKACVTVLGVGFCASCTARITGAAGVTRSGSGSTCSYGLGVVAELECKLGSVTVFRASIPFGWTVTAPCPPKWVPC